MNDPLRNNPSLPPHASNGCFLRITSPLNPDPTPSMNSPPAVTANAFNLLSESVTDLTNLVKDLALRMNANSSAVDPTLATPTTKFMAPITTVLTNGMSVTTPTSLCACFPDVEAVVITAIIAHEFKAANLHKLNPTNRDREVSYTLN
ncbi:hypothetical protein C0989_011878 [Termitomyces sp. Mn162]|nr:hypothetical protein C0989_011878 [Termitomyces sp. Mn162]